MRLIVPRMALVGGLGLLPLQTPAAEPDVSFICASEKSAYHVYFSESNKWELSIDEEKSKYVLKFDDRIKSNKWIVLKKAEEKNIDPIVLYECKDGNSSSYLSCDGMVGSLYEKFNFNFITQHFDMIAYNLGWVSDNKGYAMLYEFGSCQKQTNN